MRFIIQELARCSASEEGGFSIDEEFYCAFEEQKENDDEGGGDVVEEGKI